MSACSAKPSRRASGAARGRDGIAFHRQGPKNITELAAWGDFYSKIFAASPHEDRLEKVLANT
eukprot:20872-Alexandrium_andersonii.AAC.1